MFAEIRVHYLRQRNTFQLLNLKYLFLITQKESCTTMFIAALFTIAKTGEKTKCPSMDEWIKKTWHIGIDKGIDTDLEIQIYPQ